MQDIAKGVSEKLTDAGKIIEGGWMGFQLAVMPKTAGQVQIDETRKAFFAGAQHLFASIMCILEPGAEPTEKDLRRLTMIHAELEEFIKELKEQTLT